jgi:hypothetical protein
VTFDAASLKTTFAASSVPENPVELELSVFMSNSALLHTFVYTIEVLQNTPPFFEIPPEPSIELPCESHKDWYLTLPAVIDNQNDRVTLTFDIAGDEVT